MLSKDSPSRVYIGGLSASISQDELLSRFAPFATVKHIEIIRSPKCGISRGFGFIDLEFNDHSTWQKCLSTYNGSLWKGKKLIIEQVKTPPFQSSTQEKTPVIEEECSLGNTKKSKQKKNMFVYHSPLISQFPLVTDKNFSNFKHWKHLKYGRAVRSMRLKFPDGKLRIIDPLGYKDGLEKLFGSEKPKPYHLLQWSTPNSEDESSQNVIETITTTDKNSSIGGNIKERTRTSIVNTSMEPITNYSRVPVTETMADSDQKASIGSLGSLFDLPASKEGERLFSITCGRPTEILHSECISGSKEHQMQDEASQKPNEEGQIKIEEKQIQKTVKSVLESWIEGMPFPPQLAFSPFQRQQSSSYRMSFVSLEDSASSAIEEFWKSQKDTLIMDFKDLRRSLLSSTKRKSYGNKKFKQ